MANGGRLFKTTSSGRETGGGVELRKERDRAEQIQLT